MEDDRRSGNIRIHPFVRRISIRTKIFRGVGKRQEARFCFLNSRHREGTFGKRYTFERSGKISLNCRGNKNNMRRIQSENVIDFSIIYPVGREKTDENRDQKW